MTDLRIQTLNLTDCECKIEQNYFDWGRERSKDDWVDPLWKDASDEQRKTIAMRGYSLYDGCPVPAGNEITSAEIWATAGFRSRMIELDAIRILARATTAIPFLARIPSDLQLELASDEHLDTAGELVRCFIAYQINNAKITKVLHKMRPAFMPVLDSVVCDFLWKNFPHISKQSSPAEELFRLCQLILQTYLEPVEQIRHKLATNGYLLSNVRVLDWVLWIGWREQVDGYGFGKPIRGVWKASSLREARAKARAAWETPSIGM
jgi:hypothetical protein